MNAQIRIEEHGAHTLIQMATFYRGLSMKRANYRRKQIVTESNKLKGQLAAATEEASKAKEVAFSEGRKEGFEEGREAGLVEGHKEGFRSGHEQGIEEGKAGRITLEEHHQALSSSRVSIARDFLKSNSFKTTVEIKSVDFFNKGYKTFEAQLETLGGFAESFDRCQMDITLDGKLQPYPEEPAPEDDEFSVLLNEIEPDP
ncbi:UNVERIFIED_CONTAM: hypothetical protein Sindi_2486900 [Sesamum indicum]